MGRYLIGEIQKSPRKACGGCSSVNGLLGADICGVICKFRFFKVKNGIAVVLLGL